VIRSLHQTGEEGKSKDGMDMALCIIDTENDIIQYAGANNPLYIISSEKIEFVSTEDSGRIIVSDNMHESLILTEIKADKMPIGYYLNQDNSYISHSFKTTKNMGVYMFSDGFADQFGGPKGKKYKYKPFKQKLLQNFTKPAEQQMHLLNTEIENWKSYKNEYQETYEQVDDIVVIGLMF
jgi:serine phosphatase RsbU (regulator of sigma subunit)